MAKSTGKSHWKLRWTWRLGLLLAVLALASPGIVRIVPPEAVPARIRPAYRAFGNWVEQSLDRARLEPPAPATGAAPPVATGNITAYFAPGAEIQDALVNVVSGATKTLEVCVFDMDLERVVAALVQAQDRGVGVRVITDSDNLNLPELEPLKQHGIPVKADNREAFMHHKFVVVDGRRVWLGSFNFTRNGANLNDNNALVIEAPEIAANYLTEFEEMWQRDAFGPKSTANTPYPRVRIGETLVENYFSPDDGVLKVLVQRVGEAKQTIDVMAFSFTSRELAAALEERLAAGVRVRCIFDAGQAGNRYSQDETMESAGAAVCRRGHRGVMHHKVIIVDGRMVITGSYNFSKSAETSNDENVFIVHSPAIAAAYEREFARCWCGDK